MDAFDYEDEAVLFFSRSGKSKNTSLTIRRFNRVCEAILFAAEELAPSVVKGCSIEIGDERISGNKIYELYQSPDFPLKRIS